MNQVELVQEIKSYYGRHRDSMGGSLHFILYDAQVDDDEMRRVKKRAESLKDGPAIRISNALMLLSQEDRLKVIIDSGVSWMAELDDPT
jgi:hypothetical protein